MSPEDLAYYRVNVFVTPTQKVSKAPTSSAAQFFLFTPSAGASIPIYQWRQMRQGQLGGMNKNFNIKL